jgi:hypothetical protein
MMIYNTGDFLFKQLYLLCWGVVVPGGLPSVNLVSSIKKIKARIFFAVNRFSSGYSSFDPQQPLHS